MIDDGWTFVTVDQSSKYVGTVERRGWYPAGSDPRRPERNARNKVTTLGAVTHEGESLYLYTGDYLTADHSVQLLQALMEEFGKQLIVILDRASYFYAKDVWEFVSGERSVGTIGDTSVACSKGEKLQVWYFPPHLPELNPVEQCWNQFKGWYKYRFIETLSELKETITEAFSSINEPDILGYICPK